MTTNRLAKSEARDDDPHSIERMPGYVPPKLRKSWTPAQHCQFANDQLAWRVTNNDRHAKGLAPVRWIVSDGRVVIENAPLARIEAFGRDRNGLDAEHESRISAQQS